MAPFDLPETLLHFIHSCLPTFTAAELLLFLHQRRDQTWTPETIASTISPTSITVSAAKEYLILFETCGLVTENEPGLYQYAPNSPTLEDNVHTLLRAYNERPVTLIRTIYTIADSKIQSLADAFKLKRDS
jgi:hypothetical protein